jgi:hypothetical protein
MKLLARLIFRTRPSRIPQRNDSLQQQPGRGQALRGDRNAVAPISPGIRFVRPADSGDGQLNDIQPVEIEILDFFDKLLGGKSFAD